MYLMNCTRPDIAYAISKLSRYTSNPGEDHWKAIIRVLRYLRFTCDHGLNFTRYPAVLEGYCDANWISDTKDSKSTSGYVFTLGGVAVSWKSTKQTCIARSTMESEFIALDKAGEEAEWLRHFLEDIPMWPKPVPAICIHCDSQSAIGRAQNHMYNGKSRHIRRRHNTEDSSSDLAISDGLAAFVEDFSSRILLTYRKGFATIGDSKYTSDVNWGCMLRSSWPDACCSVIVFRASQQFEMDGALIVHQLGRSWRKTSHKPFNKEYIEIFHLFGDSEASTLSIHNFQAGNGYDLAAGSWVGPYAMCRTWESLVRFKREESELEDQSFPMAIMLFLLMKMGREVELQLSASSMLLDIVLSFQKARLNRHLFFCWFPWFLVLTKSTPGTWVHSFIEHDIHVSSEPWYRGLLDLFSTPYEG
ncbi:hypothetical protein HYC85_000452 [Camellia sinensis]|uniref:Cysteine protease n=1 Tax=Camellia sinensis TaxID=4442 RepID=A0A7J7I2I1_CAMSI|nr:hypothetical protein HYC85_000452 [Camellia sinensis]